jgi:hypothetical protein
MKAPMGGIAMCAGTATVEKPASVGSWLMVHRTDGFKGRRLA